MSDQVMANRLLNVLKEKAAMGMGVSAGARRKSGSKTVKKRASSKSSKRSSSCPARRRCAVGTRKKCVKGGEMDELLEMIGEGVRAGVSAGRGPSAKSKAAAKRNPWVQYLKSHAKKHGITYGEAMADPSIRKSYCAAYKKARPTSYSKSKACKSSSKTAKKRTVSKSKTAKKKAVGSKKCKKGQRLASISYKRKSGKKIGPFKKCVKARGKGYDYMD